MAAPRPGSAWTLGKVLPADPDQVWVVWSAGPKPGTAWLVARGDNRRTLLVRFKHGAPEAVVTP